MEDSEARLRAEHIIKELGKYSLKWFTLEDALFLAYRFKRLPGTPPVPVLALGESDLRELEKIAGRVRAAASSKLRPLEFPKKE